MSLIVEETVVPSAYEFLAEATVDPWHRFSAIKQDCILLIEFCEVEGPKAVLTIPEKLDSHFDVNEFSVRVMTADYQSTSSRLIAGQESDIQMLLADTEQGVHTYVHYFTLYDIEARGYVRPYCVAYVSKDKQRLLRNFELLRKRLGQLLEPIKQCNWTAFVIDVQFVIATLQGLECKNVSSYYSLCYEPTAESEPVQNRDDSANFRFVRLHRELNAAMTNLSNKYFTSICSTKHSPSVGVDFINLVANNQKSILKNLRLLCCCAFDNFCANLALALKSFQTEVKQFSKMPAVFFGRSPLLIAACTSKQSKDVPDSDTEDLAEQDGDNFFLDDCDVSFSEHDAVKHALNLNSSDLLLSMLPSLPQLLYSLLIGRFTVIFGRQSRKGTVTTAVEQLSNLIPSTSGRAYYSVWNEGDIKAAAFGDCKVYGQRVDNGQSIDQLMPQNFKAFVTLLDFNAEMLHSPKYVGSFLKQVSGKRHKFPNDRTLISYVKAVFADICCMAYILFYFVYADQDCYRRNIRCLKAFCEKLCITQSDFKILRHLAELLKLQTIGHLAMNGHQENLFFEQEEIQKLKL